MNELLYATGMRFRKGTVFADSGAESPRQATVVGSKFIQGCADLSISWEKIAVGDISTIGAFELENVGQQEVEVCESGGGPARLRIPVGQTIRGWVASGMTELWVRSAISTSKVKYLIVEA